MALLFDEDYKILQESGLKYSEVEEPNKRFLIVHNYPLPEGLYVHQNGDEKSALTVAEVLVVIPNNYNTSGIDMIWTYPRLLRSDERPIPASSDVGGDDPRHVGTKEYCRWSRHWPEGSWHPKTDNVQKILSRIEWALQNPDTK